ncbi:MAG: hypothetical protein V4538_16185 [Bacteroidota bacterium]
MKTADYKRAAQSLRNFAVGAQFIRISKKDLNEKLKGVNEFFESVKKLNN